MDAMPPGPPRGEDNVSISPPPRLRKNGKAQSCEPCRKSKLRCDHELPCGRCARLGRSDKCFYHPAPLTKAPGRSLSPQPDERPLKRPATAPAQAARPQPPAPVRPSPARKPSNTGTNPLALRTGSTIGYRRNRGMKPKLFYGQTAHSAILSENRLGLAPGDDPFEEQDVDDDNSWATPQMSDFSTAILEWMPEQDISMRAIKRYFQITFSITSHEQMLTYFHDSFWQMYGSRLAGPRKPSRICEVAEEMCRNTKQKPMRTPATNQEFLESLRGRWESIGLIYLIYASINFMLPEHDPLLKELVPADMSRKDFSLSMLEAADACLILCDDLDPQSNILAVLLFYRCVCMQSLLNVEGDTSLNLWKRAGSMMSTLTGHGFHQLEPTTNTGSILYAESQKRVFATAFMWSMALSAFLGRPPPLSSRYAQTPPPLDVSDLALMSDDLSKVTATLDENGWNTENKIYPATLARAGYMSSFMYEEILEISLGPQGQDPYSLSARIRSVRGRMKTFLEQLPPIFSTPLNRMTFNKRDAWEVCAIAQVHLTNLHTEFLLERIDHPEKDELRHLDAAQKMLNIVVVTWNERDRLPEHYDELHWYITCYGIPSASALGINLWKQANAPQSVPLVPHRSDIIQNLSLFIACLDWVTPQHGNYVLCKRSRKLIKNILDGVLAPAPPKPSPSSTLLDYPVFDFDNMPDLPAFNAGLDDWFMADWANVPRMDFS